MRLLVTLILIFIGIPSFAQDNYDNLLVGTHNLSLQWISWEKFGTVTISKTDTLNIYDITGTQFGDDNKDYLKIHGKIKPLDNNKLEFTGVIEIKVNYLNKGNLCLRKGKFIFLATGKRKYWRLQEMDNPCDEVVDYVDIYFNNTNKKQ